MALGRQPPVPPIRLGAEAMMGKEKGKLEIQVKDGDGMERMPVCREAQRLVIIKLCKWRKY